MCPSQTAAVASKNPLSLQHMCLGIEWFKGFCEAEVWLTS